MQYIKGGDEVTCMVNGTSLTFLVDSGCPVNVITRKALHLLEARGGKIELRPQHKQFTAYATNQPLKIDGCFNARVAFNGRHENEQLYVATEGKCCLLGSGTAKKLGILSIKTQVSNQMT